MKYGIKGKQREKATGRSLLMVIVILTSAFSFTLGYFVGKSLRPETGTFQEKPSQPQLISAPAPQEVEKTVQEQPSQDNEKSNVDNSALPKPGNEETRLPEKASPVQVDTTRNQAAAKADPAGPAAPQRKSLRLETEESAPVQKTEGKKDEKKDSAKADIFTVQAGAFKNIKEAEALKRKLEKKGYKVYVKKFKTEKNIRLFKVTAGEFTEKEKAEKVADKLKTAGLKAFVTLKNEDAGKEGNNSDHKIAAARNREEKLR